MKSVWSLIVCLLLGLAPAQAQVIDIADRNTDITRYPPILVQAFVSATDRDFYQKAAWASPVTKMVVTITAPPEPNRRSSGLQRLAAARQWATNFDHDELVALALDGAYFGRRCFGAEDASRAFFGKDLAALDPTALIGLAIITTHPVGYLNDPSRLHARTVEIAQSIMNDGHLTRQEFDAARDRPLQQVESSRRCDPNQM